MDWFTSDLHLGHRALLEHRPQFSTVEEMNNTIISSFNVVSKGDRLFLLGDLGFDFNLVHSFLESLLKKKIEVFWIQGNHDKDTLWKMEFTPSQEKYLHRRQGMTVKAYDNYHSLYLCHYPCLIWDKSHYGSYMIHGHGHASTADKEILNCFKFGHRLNVNIELHDYKLWSRDEIEKTLSLSNLDQVDNLDEIVLKTIKDPEWTNFKPELDILFSEIKASLQKFYSKYSDYQINQILRKINCYDKDDIIESAVLYALQDPRD